MGSGAAVIAIAIGPANKALSTTVGYSTLFDLVASP